MNLFSSRLILTLCVINLMVLIGGGVSLILYDGEQLPEVNAISSDELLTNMSARQQRNPVQMASLEQRPLFHQNRKQYTVKKVIPAKKQTPQRITPLTAYQLKGIVYIKGGSSFILLLNKNSGKSQKLKVGDSFDGWIVNSISKASAKLTRGTEAAQLELIKSTNNRK